MSHRHLQIENKALVVEWLLRQGDTDAVFDAVTDIAPTDAILAAMFTELNPRQFGLAVRGLNDELLLPVLDEYNTSNIPGVRVIEKEATE